MKLLAAWGFKVGSIHGNKSQNQRDRTLTEFRNGELDVLVATDVAARGIDIPTVRHVYNFDMPNVPENYVHRIGRTARAGAKGSPISFCAPAEMGELQAIEKLLKKPIPGSRWRAVGGGCCGGGPEAGAEPRPAPRATAARQGSEARRPSRRASARVRPEAARAAGSRRSRKAGSFCATPGRSAGGATASPRPTRAGKGGPCPPVSSSGFSI